MRIAVGTRKGAFVGDDRSGSWEFSGPWFPEAEVASVTWSGPDDSSLLVGAMSYFWGPLVQRSDDGGATWAEQEAIAFGETDGASVARIWHLQPDPTRPGVVWAGCEPTSLWRSDDDGAHFELVRGLWNHPHRAEWEPGAGGAAVHTVIPRPDGSLLIAMSTGGVYRSFDEGVSWNPANVGILADFLPGDEPEYGQCVHRIAMDAVDNDVLYAQNHGGVYRSDDGGLRWTSIAQGLPADFGFVMLAHPTTSRTAWVLPLDGGAGRVPPGGHLRLHRTTDRGATWSPCEGFPAASWSTVVRDAAHVVARPDGSACVAVGTRDGCVYVSTDDGLTFTEAARHLPDVLSLRVAL